jgi:hypothetical protein
MQWTERHRILSVGWAYVQPLTQEPMPPSGPEWVGPAGGLLLVAELCDGFDDWLALLAGVGV